MSPVSQVLFVRELLKLLSAKKAREGGVSGNWRLATAEVVWEELSKLAEAKGMAADLRKAKVGRC